jgi:hypothetical protein
MTDDIRPAFIKPEWERRSPLVPSLFPAKDRSTRMMIVLRAVAEFVRDRGWWPFPREIGAVLHANQEAVTVYCLYLRQTGHLAEVVYKSYEGGWVLPSEVRLGPSTPRRVAITRVGWLALATDPIKPWAPYSTLRTLKTLKKIKGRLLPSPEELSDPRFQQEARRRLIEAGVLRPPIGPNKERPLKFHKRIKTTGWKIKPSKKRRRS